MIHVYKISVVSFPLVQWQSSWRGGRPCRLRLSTQSPYTSVILWVLLPCLLKAHLCRYTTHTEVTHLPKLYVYYYCLNCHSLSYVLHVHITCIILYWSTWWILEWIIIIYKNHFIHCYEKLKENVSWFAVFFSFR